MTEIRVAFLADEEFDTNEEGALPETVALSYFKRDCKVPFKNVPFDLQEKFNCGIVLEAQSHWPIPMECNAEHLIFIRYKDATVMNGQVINRGSPRLSIRMFQNNTRRSRNGMIDPIEVATASNFKDAIKVAAEWVSELSEHKKSEGSLKNQILHKSKNKAERLQEIRRLLVAQPQGIKKSEIARELSIYRSSAIRYLDELSVLLPIWEDENGVVGLQTEGFQSTSTPLRGKDIIDELKSLISEGEGDFLEFKVTACWDQHNRSKNGKITANILKAVVGFMNSDTGGTVLIGVADNGEIVGLADDFAVADTAKPNRDGYQLYLSNKLNNVLGGESISFYKISFHQIEEKEICRIQVQPSSRPRYFEGKFYARNGNQALLLTTQEAVKYINHRWN